MIKDGVSKESWENAVKMYTDLAYENAKDDAIEISLLYQSGNQRKKILSKDKHWRRDIIKMAHVHTAHVMETVIMLMHYNESFLVPEIINLLDDIVAQYDCFFKNGSTIINADVMSIPAININYSYKDIDLIISFLTNRIESSINGSLNRLAPKIKPLDCMVKIKQILLVVRTEILLIIRHILSEIHNCDNGVSVVELSVPMSDMFIYFSKLIKKKFSLLKYKTCDLEYFISLYEERKNASSNSSNDDIDIVRYERKSS